ncbi:hypothetical protein [Saccharomonospora azurea]|uniref:hypothetical protein n=1 Tax=Saccharomonospora azurea TaxID=40988 RepID=UPI0002E41E6E|nr:hypothetical protein [Saccharomonospora azurea]
MSLGVPTEAVAEQLTTIDQIDSFAAGIGWCNGVGSIRAASPEGVFATLERIRALPGVKAVESWAHLHAVKEEHDRPTLNAP